MMLLWLNHINKELATRVSYEVAVRVYEGIKKKKIDAKTCVELKCLAQKSKKIKLFAAGLNKKKKFSKNKFKLYLEFYGFKHMYQFYHLDMNKEDSDDIPIHIQEI